MAEICGLAAREGPSETNLVFSFSYQRICVPSATTQGVEWKGTGDSTGRAPTPLQHKLGKGIPPSHTSLSP